jgi:hypothetical protein
MEYHVPYQPFAMQLIPILKQACLRDERNTALPAFASNANPACPGQLRRY